MIELATVVTALSAYRARLKAEGKLMKAMAVVFLRVAEPVPLSAN